MVTTNGIGTQPMRPVPNQVNDFGSPPITDQMIASQKSVE